MKKFFKILFTIIGVILALIIFIYLAVWMYFTIANTFFGDDIPPPNDQDLMQLERNIPEDQNAYFVLEKYFSSSDSGIVYDPIEKNEIDKYLKKEKWNQEVVGEFLKNNAELLKNISITVNMEFYQNPYYDHTTLKGFEEIFGFMSIEKLIFLESDYFLKVGQTEKAINTLLMLDELLSKRIESDNGLMVMNRDKVNVKIIEIVSSQNLSKRELLKIIGTLKNRPNNLDCLISSIKFKYTSEKNLVKLIKKGNGDQEDTIEKMGKKPFRLKTNKTIKMFGDLAREIIASSQKPCSPLKETISSLMKKTSDEYYIDDNIKTILRLFFQENFAGKFIVMRSHFVAVGTIEEGRLLRKRCEFDFNNSAVQIIIAMKIYFSETGKLPNSLEDLSEYLGEIPLDIFSDKEILYSKEKKEIRSIGCDGKSETEDDLIFEINFKEVDKKIPRGVN